MVECDSMARWDVGVWWSVTAKLRGTYCTTQSGEIETTFLHVANIYWISCAKYLDLVWEGQVEDQDVPGPSLMVGRNTIG